MKLPETPLSSALLTFEHRHDGLGVGQPRPRISWTFPAATDQHRVHEWELELTNQEGTSWNSDHAPSDRVLVPWIGDGLESRESREVTVRGRAEDGRVVCHIEGTVEAGLLAQDDWIGTPIAAPPSSGSVVFRREFQVADLPVTARWYSTFQGIGYTTLNGSPVSDEVLAPGWQSYRHRMHVATDDVTQLIRKGRNALEIHLAEGWFAGRIGFFEQRGVYGDRPSALGQLELTAASGRRTTVPTDADWEWKMGPASRASLYDGETFDGQWASQSGHSPWHPVETVPPFRSVKLEAPSGPPVRRTQVLSPVRALTTPSGKTVIDFGQNLVGWVHVNVDGPAGTEIVLRHAEVLEHGELGTRPLRMAEATDRYRLRGGGPEEWEPSFTYHGFRYVEVSGWPGSSEPLEGLTAVVVHSDMTRSGWFASSHDKLNQLHENVVWSTRGNFVSLPTDCPQRDERLGWTGDIALFAPTAAYLYDCTGLLQSWLLDLSAEQYPDGTVPFFVPEIPFPLEFQSNPLFRHASTAVWGDACVLVPFALYEATGDVQILRDQYDSMRRWIDGIDALVGPSHVWEEGFQYGDWLDPVAPPENPAAGLTEPALVATAFFAYSARLVGRAARLIGAAAEVSRYEDLASAVVAAFQSRFIKSDDRMTSDSQTAYAIAIQLDLLPDGDLRDTMGARLVELVRRDGHRIGTGFVGTPLVLQALTRVGAIEDAYGLVLQTQRPSWLYAVDLGATTIWERWDSMLPDGSINPGGMTSFNHYTFGSVASWLHATVGGLAPIEAGYRRVSIAPRPHSEVLHAETSHLTPFGLASVSWQVTDDELHVQVTLPQGVTGSLELEGEPARELASGTHAIVASAPARLTRDLAPTE